MDFFQERMSPLPWYLDIQNVINPKFIFEFQYVSMCMLESKIVQQGDILNCLGEL